MKKKFIILFIILIFIAVFTFLVIKSKTSNKFIVPKNVNIGSNIQKIKDNEKIDEDNLILIEEKSIDVNEQELNQEEVPILENIDELNTESLEKTSNEIPNILEQKENKIQEKQPQQIKEQIIDEKEYTETPKCSETSHGVGVGNSNKWFSTKNESIKYYEELIKVWGDKWERFEIDSETYDKNCPYGYEVWTCPICNKWTINFYYR